jgi:DNA-binding FadR family transcriptional regulator
VPGREEASVHEYLDLAQTIQARDRDSAVAASQRHVEAAKGAAIKALELFEQ